MIRFFYRRLPIWLVVIGFLGATPWNLNNQGMVRLVDLAADFQPPTESEDEEHHGKAKLAKYSLSKGSQSRGGRSRIFRRLFGPSTKFYARLRAAFGRSRILSTRLVLTDTTVLRLHVPRRQPLSDDDPDQRRLLPLAA